MKNHLVIIVDDGILPQTQVSWESIDLNYIVAFFSDKGFKVDVLDYSEFSINHISVNNAYIIYASSQIPERKLFIDDVLTSLPKNNVFIPHYDMFRCHDNKGYQELYKRKIGLSGLLGRYYIDFPENNDVFPVVLKKVSGYGSVGVWKADSKEKYDSLKGYFIKSNYVCLIKKIAKFLLNRKTSAAAIKYCSKLKRERVLIQEFVPDLTYDYKILIFDKKYYVLKRGIKRNDFRASGSGLWTFPDPSSIDVALLGFAEACFVKMNIPFVSFDICEKEQNYFLIEFQGIHFGPVTIMNSSGYFEKDTKWNFIKAKSILEVEFSKSIYSYIQSEISGIKF